MAWGGWSFPMYLFGTYTLSNEVAHGLSSGDAATGDIYTVCLNKGVNTSVAAVSIAMNPPALGIQWLKGQVACPSGAWLTGGGYAPSDTRMTQLSALACSPA